MPFILALKRQRQRLVGFCEFEAGLVYRVSLRTARVIPGLKKINHIV